LGRLAWGSLTGHKWGSLGWPSGFNFIEDRRDASIDQVAKDVKELL